MKKFFIILLTTVSFFSCKPKQQATVQPDSNFNTIDADSLFITIDRSPCFGKCPWYNAKIYESGYTVYQGKRDVSFIGLYFTQLSAGQLKQLKDKALSINYFQMKDKYDNEGVTDLPSAATSVQLDGKRKTITNRYLGPKELDEFEKMIDALFTNAEMKKLKQTIDMKE